MDKKEIDAFERASDILNALRKGAVIVASANGRANVMTISWGTFGREWERDIFTIFIRETRFTHGLLDANSEFVACFPRDGFDRRLVGRLGTMSGADTDKLAVVPLLEADEVLVPVVDAPSIVLECRMLWRRDQHIEEHESAYAVYARDANGEYVGPNHDTIYCGEIVKSCILE